MLRGFFFVAWVTWKIARWTKKVEETRCKVDKLPCDDHLKNIKVMRSGNGSVDARLSDIEKTLDRWNDSMVIWL